MKIFAIFSSKKNQAQKGHIRLKIKSYKKTKGTIFFDFFQKFLKILEKLKKTVLLF